MIDMRSPGLEGDAMWFIAIGEEHMITLPCPPIFTCSQYQHAASSATAFSTVHTARSIRCDGIGAAPGSRWQVPAASRCLPWQPGLAAGASLSCSARACTVLQSAQQYELFSLQSAQQYELFSLHSAQQYELFSLHGAQQCELLGLHSAAALSRGCATSGHYRGEVSTVSDRVVEGVLNEIDPPEPYVRIC